VYIFQLTDKVSLMRFSFWDKSWIRAMRVLDGLEGTVFTQTGAPARWEQIDTLHPAGFPVANQSEEGKYS
jgi:hypothetical protein